MRMRMVESYLYECRDICGTHHETGRLGIASKADELESIVFYLVGWSQAVPLYLHQLHFEPLMASPFHWLPIERVV